MFKRDDLIEFVNSIINKSNQKEEIKNNLIKFIEYLKLTKMADEETLQELENIISCIEELLIIKEKFGKCNIIKLLETKEKEKNKTKTKTKIKKEENIHYRHYHNDYEPSYYSSSCGSSYGGYSSSC